MYNSIYITRVNMFVQPLLKLTSIQYIRQNIDKNLELCCVNAIVLSKF